MMKDEQIRLLKGLGFEWETTKEPSEAIWDNHIERLHQFKAEHGHLHVPTGCQQKYSLLGRWVMGQRQQYKKHLRGE